MNEIAKAIAEAIRDDNGVTLAFLALMFFSLGGAICGGVIEEVTEAWNGVPCECPPAEAEASP